MESGVFIQDFAVVMVTAGVAGWVCQRVGLSVIVGYLLAGLLVGPGTPGVFIQDDASVRAMADMGLVFLMFSIGMGLSLRRLQRLGPAAVVAAFIGAGLTFVLSRGYGSVQGWSEPHAVVIGAMLVVSSSAVIGKVLSETGASHTRAGQLAMGVTVLEDLVAIVALTLLGSYLGLSAGAAAPLWQTIGGFGIFVLLLGLGSLLLVPRFLRWLGTTASGEVQTVLLVALLLGLGILAQGAGYSLALGAFLLGAVVAETPERGQVGRLLEGLKDVFSAVFFVTIGMQIDIGTLGNSLPLILTLSAFTLAARFLATTVSLVLTGNSVRDAAQAGIMLTPLGEFSFVIAQLGVQAAVLPAEAYPVAVGVSLLTTLVAPALVRRSDRLGAWIERREPQVLRDGVKLYHGLLVRIRDAGQASMMWRLGKKRFIQIGVEMAVVTGLLLGARPAQKWLNGWVGGETGLVPGWVPLVFWIAVGLLALPMLLALWRNGQALAMILGETTARGMRKSAFVRKFLLRLFEAAFAVMLFLWLWLLLPIEQALGLLGVVLLVLGLVLAFSWRRLVFLHSQVEVELDEALAAPVRAGVTLPPWLKQHRDDWRLNINDFIVPDGAACAGRSLFQISLRRETGCSIVGIDRQGYMLGNPGPETVLYPLDRLLLLGTVEQIAAARALLVVPTPRKKGEAADREMGFEEVAMDVIAVPDGCSEVGRALVALQPPEDGRVQVLGIRRGGRALLNPGGDETIRSGDELLVLATPTQVRSFERWLGLNVNQVESED